MRVLPQLTGRYSRAVSWSLAALAVCFTPALGAPAPSPAPRAILVETRAYEPPGALQTTMGITNASAVFTIPQVTRPFYLLPGLEPTFGTVVMRVTNDAGSSNLPMVSAWGLDARHTYSKQQPWNADGTLISVQNRSGGTPSVVILDGFTFLPRYTPCGNYDYWDYRWHPSRSHAHEQINVNQAGTELSWYDVTTCTKTRSWTLPIASNYGIGSGEGNPSQDGRFVCVCDGTRLVVVDMDPQPPFAAYPSQRIGPVYTIPPCTLPSCVVNNVSVSPSGRYIDVNYDGGSDSTNDAHRIFEVDPNTLAIQPHAMDAASLRCGSYQAHPEGWIFPLKHADMALNPFDGNEDVMIGGRACPGSKMGMVVMVRLRDGRVTPLSDPDNEAYLQHTSTRNIERPGWAYESYEKQSGKRFSDEVVAIKMDGSQSVERLAHKHSASSGCYRCESHPVASPDGTRVLFASNWNQDCVGCPASNDIKDFVILNSSASVDVPAPGPSLPSGLALESVRPNPAVSAIGISYSLPSAEPAQVEIVDAAGRRVWHRDLGTPGPGPHVLDVERDRRWLAGVYWLRLTQGGRSATTKVTFVR